ncbi:MAG: amidohydrolase [Candidatus Marinimicrobia bacterium]|nr:amidohydrolase [Candidatus Neomarinimicrobiota bacterium]|tara:strand:+ start:3107 stop:4780 length:1674 start_codon:yes stop_codon:yes gene_type:complete
MIKIFFHFSLYLFILSGCEKQSINKIYFNGIIWTGDNDISSATAMVLEKEHFIFVGKDKEALDMATEDTELIDLMGRFVTPGFIDNHVHFISGGLQLSRIDLSGVSTKSDFQERIAYFDKILLEDSWMIGGNWDHELWGGSYPDKSWIDEVVQNRPVFLDRLDGHMSLANSKALEIADITAETIDPVGGVIIRNSKNEPTGILKDLAMNLILDLVPPESDVEKDKALKKAMDYALSLGLTQVHDMGSWDDLQTYKRNHDKGELKIRVKIYPWYTNWKRIIEYVKRNGRGDDWLRWDGIKGMMDGSLGSRTAWMHKPYLHDINSNDKESLPTLGVITIKDTTDFKYLLRETDKVGIQHAVHAIGDRANDWILDEFKNIEKDNGHRDRRSRIEHSQHLSKNAIKRFAKQNIIPSMQPYHLFDDGSWAHKRIDYDLLSRTYIFNSLIKSGANLTFGSDWTVASLNPAKGIYAAITRRTRNGKNENGWFPEEKISVEDALKCYTINNAYAAFWEEKTGSIASGKYADFVVHSINYLNADPEKILESKVLRTVVGGKDYLFE